MFNNKFGYNSDNYSQRDSYDSTPKRIPHQINTDIDLNNNNFDKLYDKINAQIDKSNETQNNLEKKIQEIESKLREVTMENNNLQSDINCLNNTVANLEHEIRQLGNLEIKNNKLSEENKRLQSEISLIKSILNDSIQMKDEELIKHITISVENIRKPIETEISKLTKTIESININNSINIDYLLNKLSNNNNDNNNDSDNNNSTNDNSDQYSDEEGSYSDSENNNNDESIDLTPKMTILKEVQPISTTLPITTHAAETKEKSIFEGLNLAEAPSKPSFLFGKLSTTTATTLENREDLNKLSVTTNCDDKENYSVGKLEEIKHTELFSMKLNPAVNKSSFIFGEKSKETVNNQSIFGNIQKNETCNNFTVDNNELKHNGNDSEEEEEEEHDPDFKPIIDLPPLIQIIHDDEQRDVLFKSRCKLYRFVNGEWKERGLGDMKILRSLLDGSVTLLMRREQVHKICCNQRVSKESHKMMSMGSDKSFCWTAADFSEGESVMEKFAVKFGNKSLMDEFSRVIADVQMSL